MNLEEEIKKIVEANGALFYDIQTVTEYEETVYRVSITHPEGVTLDMCADISHDLSPFLDVNPPMVSPYRLEVSSPGIERKLSRAEHFINAIGENVKLKVPGQDRLKGVLKSADKSGITVISSGQELHFGYSEIAKARTYFDWDK
jgi:ribosome maturation factor RimP